MRFLAGFLLALTIGCGARAPGQAANDAGDGSDVGMDATDAAETTVDAATERAEVDTGGVDGGAFACGVLTCAADEYCVPMIWASCHAPPDGGACPTGMSDCDRGAGQMGCRAPCYQQRCTKTLPFGCSVSNIPAPRWLYCLCE